ncbi:hypothetical protein SAM19_01402 [Brevibacillus laterosporus]|nr:hypothetical protein [Brevibacillus laterosporus]
MHKGGRHLFTHLYPNFNKGRILKTDMLANLRDYPRDFLDIQYKEYSDGIITGSEIRIGEQSITITPGIVKHSGRLYVLKEEHELMYQANNRETVVKIRFHEQMTDSDFTINSSEIVLDEQVELGQNELELGRFKLKEGAKLRSEYQSFVDLATEYNTFITIHVPYASESQSTLAPTIMRYFARELVKGTNLTAFDISFALLCLNEGKVNREVILTYLANRLGTGFKEYSNGQIHKHLGRILDEVRGGGKARADMRQGGFHRMIVD